MLSVRISTFLVEIVRDKELVAGTLHTAGIFAGLKAIGGRYHGCGEKRSS